MDKLSNKKPFISIIIPAKNEEKKISSTIDKIERYMLERYISYEIIIVSDSSLCGTVNLIKNKKGLKIIDQKNLGKGYAVKCGMLSAKGEFRLFMDADNSVDIKNLEKILKIINKEKIYIASIKKGRNHIRDENKIYRKIMGVVSSKIINYAFRLDIKDTQRGFKLFPQKIAEKIFSEQTTHGFGFDVEILLEAKFNGIEIIEIPVDWHNKKSKNINFTSYIKTLWEIGIIYLRMRKKHKNQLSNTS